MSSLISLIRYQYQGTEIRRILTPGRKQLPKVKIAIVGLARPTHPLVIRVIEQTPRIRIIQQDGEQTCFDYPLFFSNKQQDRYIDERVFDRLLPFMRKNSEAKKVRVKLYQDSSYSLPQFLQE